MRYEYQENGLTLRVLDERHVDEIYNFYYNNRDYFDPYEMDKPANFYTKEFVTSLVKAEFQEFLHQKHIRYYLYASDFNEIIGCVSFSDIKKGMCSCIIGYKIAEKYAGYGLGKRMVSMAIKAIMADYGMHRIEAYIHPENVRSLRLCESLGFISEGIAHAYAMIGGQWLDHLRYVYII
jgi:ribosomal-protein-alanine N-acetyltransferase